MVEGYSLSDIAAATGNGANGNNGMWGDGAWWIIVLFLFMWGRGGWGNGDNGSGTPGFQGWATRADINDGFALNDIQNGIRGIQQGLCDTTYALNNTIQQGNNATQVAILQGFNGVERIFASLSTQLAQCCCETKEAIQGVNYNMATNTCNILNTMNNNTRDIIQSQEAGTRAILDYLCQEKISDLQSENQTLKLAASQANQNVALGAMMEANTAEILRRTAPLPVPAYTVPAPYPYAGGFGCGCGSYN